MSSDSSEFLNMYVEVLYEPRDYVCRHLKKQMDWSQGDTVPFVRSPGPPCVMVPTGSPCKSSGNSGPLHCLQPEPSAVPWSPLAWVVHTDLFKTVTWLLLFCTLFPESFEFPVCIHGGCIHILWS